VDAVDEARRFVAGALARAHMAGGGAALLGFHSPR